MQAKNLLKRVTIKRDGTIILGKFLACDGFDTGCSIGAITHAHGDHIRGLHSSLHFYRFILVSPQTRQLLIANEGQWLKRRTNLIPLPFRKIFKYNDNKISLHPATHILGSAKILLEQTDGTRILYTGDFKMPQKPVQADIVICEATYGDPRWIRLYGKEFAARQLIRLVKQKLKLHAIQIHATQGKVQEIMALLRRAGIQDPFLMPRNIYTWALVYMKYGKDLGQCIPLESEEAQEILRSKTGYILFFTIGSNILDLNKFFCIKVSGLRSLAPFQEITKNYYSITISDHADLKELLTFIEKTKARAAITDGSRPGEPQKLAREIKRRLKINAYSMPFS